MSKVSLFGPIYGAGGAGRLHSYIADYLVQNGVGTDILIHENIPRETYLKDKVLDNVIDIRGDNVGNFENLGSIAREATKLYRLGSYVRNAKPDVLISGMTKHNLKSVVACKISNPSTDVHLIEQNVIRPDVTNRSKKIPYLISALYPLASGIIAVSEDVKKDLVNICSIDSRKVKVIPNAVDVESINRKADEEVEIEKAYEERKVIVSVGSINYQKNYELLIRSFALLREKVDARLVVLGDGEKRETIEEMAGRLGIRNNIQFMGVVSNPFKYMQMSDALVLASRYEGLPLVVLESIATGTPVVGTETPGGTSDVINDNRYGEIAKTCSPERMAQNIEKVLKKEYDTEEIVERARDFDKRKIIPEILEAASVPIWRMRTGK
jgi:glycosyltransferase involved in cell wall biosynthesis